MTAPYGDVRDEIDISQAGVLTNNARWAPSSLQSGLSAVEFDGVDDYVNFSSILPNFTGKTSTLAVWMRIDGFDTNGAIPWSTTNAASHTVYWQLTSTTAYTHNRSIGATSQDWSDGLWHLFTWRTDGVLERGALWVDEQEDVEAAIAVPASLASGAKNFYLGKYIGGSTWDLQGAIGPVGFWDLALTDQEIAALYRPKTRWSLYDEVGRLDYLFVPAAGGTKMVTGSLDSAIQQQLSVTASLGGALQGTFTGVASLGAALSLAQSLTVSLQGALQASLTVQASLSATVLSISTASAELGAALQVSQAITASLDAAIQATAIATASLDGALQQVLTVSGSLDASIAAAGGATNLTASLNAAVQAARTLTANLDAALQVPGQTATAVLDAGIAAAATLVASINAVVAVTATVTSSINAVVQVTQILTASLDASLGGLFSPAASRTHTVPGGQRSYSIGGGPGAGGVRTYVVPARTRRH